MDKVGSPFLGEIKQCKQSMRKLRKKIYKYRMARNECVGRGKGSQEELLAIFKARNVPEFLTEMLCKRRSLNVSTIKNVQVGKQVSLEEIRGRTDRQENEISEIFVDHKARMVDVKRRNLLAMERGERGVLAEKNIDQNGRNGVHFGLEEHSETRQYSNLGQESTIGQELTHYPELDDSSVLCNIHTEQLNETSKFSQEHIAKQFLNLHETESSFNMEQSLFNF